MDPVLASCRFLLSVVRALIDQVRVRDDFDVLRPAYASRSVARRLASGLAYVEAYLRRVLLVMALELEPNLKDCRGPLRRPHGRKAKDRWNKPPRFVVFKDLVPPFTSELLDTFAARKANHCNPYWPDPQPVALARLYQRLDHLSAIVKAPLARAKRLAFHLARTREGPILAPDPALRPPST